MKVCVIQVRADQMEAAGRLLEDGTVVGRPQPPAELVHEEEHDDEVGLRAVVNNFVNF